MAEGEWNSAELHEKATDVKTFYTNHVLNLLKRTILQQQKIIKGRLKNHCLGQPVSSAVERVS